MVKKLLFLFIIITQFSVAQNKRSLLYGIISDDLGPLLNVHVLNLQTKTATNSNELGKFRIYAQPNDSIKITSVGYKTKIISVKNDDFGMSGKQIHLESEIIELDEIELKKHNLLGTIDSDIKQTPEDRIAKLTGLAVSEILNMDPEAIKNMGYGEDELHLQKISAPGIPNAFQGAGVSQTLPDYDGIKKRKLRKEINFKETFPQKILSRFGEHFFFTELKIPREQFYHFLEYCNPLGIEQLFKDQKTMELVALFNKESKSYLKIIVQEK